VTSLLSSQQTHICRNKTCLLLRQKYACHDKSFVTAKVFVATKIFCRDKHNYVVAKVLLQQECFCCVKRCVAALTNEADKYSVCLNVVNVCVESVWYK